MDPIVSSIVAAVTAGAIAASKDVASGAVKDAYNGLKRILTDTYKANFFASLENKPESKSAANLAAEEIADSNAAGDKEVVAATEKLLAEIEKDEPAHSALEEGGVKIRDLTAKRSIIIGKITAAKGVDIEGMKADVDINLGDITSGSGGN